MCGPSSAPGSDLPRGRSMLLWAPAPGMLNTRMHPSLGGLSPPVPRLNARPQGSKPRRASAFTSRRHCATQKSWRLLTPRPGSGLDLLCGGAGVDTLGRGSAGKPLTPGRVRPSVGPNREAGWAPAWSEMPQMFPSITPPGALPALSMQSPKRARSGCPRIYFPATLGSPLMAVAGHPLSPPLSLCPFLLSEVGATSKTLFLLFWPCALQLGSPGPNMLEIGQRPGWLDGRV